MNAVRRDVRPRLLPVSDRDRRILERARTLLGASAGFGDAVRALREAAEELVPDGKVFFLGGTPDSAIIGSIISGVGIVERASGLELVRARDGVIASLGWFRR